MAGQNQISQFLDGLLFTRIFKSFRMSIQPIKMTIAFAALAILCALGWVMDLSNTVVAVSDVTAEQVRRLPMYSTFSTEHPTELHCYLVETENSVKRYIKQHGNSGQRIGVFATLWNFGSARFTEAVFSLFELRFRDVIGNIGHSVRALFWAFSHHLVYSIIYFSAALAVISIAGGAICRITALQFARDERPGLIESVKFSLRRFVSLFTAPLVPLGIIVLVGLCIFVLGLIGNIPRAGEIIIAIGLPAALIAAVLMTLILVGAVAGAPLVFPAIGFEATDGFDAISRAFSYVYARPWRMGFYIVITTFYGAICYLFVRLCAFLLLFVTHFSLSLAVWTSSSVKGLNKLMAIWPKPQFLNLVQARTIESAIWSEALAGFLVYLVVLVVFGLVVSFLMSFYFSASTIIYALMRKHVDDTALEDVYTELEQLRQQAESDSLGQEPQGSTGMTEPRES